MPERMVGQSSFPTLKGTVDKVGECGKEWGQLEGLVEHGRDTTLGARDVIFINYVIMDKTGPTFCPCYLMAFINPTILNNCLLSAAIESHKIFVFTILQFLPP